MKKTKNYDSMSNYYSPSELIINNDGSIYHLHLRPEQLADKVILVGDPERVDLVASHFEDIECTVHNREFRTVTGHYKGKRITVQATGIGCDNIDIVLNELDACANIDFSTREDKPVKRTLTLVRIGTCGGLQPHTPIGSFIASVKSIGFDGLLNFYGLRNEVCDLEMEEKLLEHLHWAHPLCIPYIVPSDEELLERIAGTDMVRGYTVACGGFFGPQGRQLRVPLADPMQNEKISSFVYNDLPITNFEMESSALAGLSRMLGHKALTCCMVVANRVAKTANADHQGGTIDELIVKVLDRI